MALYDSSIFRDQEDKIKLSSAIPKEDKREENAFSQLHAFLQPELGDKEVDVRIFHGCLQGYCKPVNPRQTQISPPQTEPFKHTIR